MSIQLRWLTTKRHVTADMAREYARNADISLMHAKAELEKNRGPVLQYRNVGAYGDAIWHDVPHVLEYIDEQTN